MRPALVAAMLVLPVAALAVSAVASTVPCTDPRGCPDLHTDSGTMNPKVKKERFDASDCAVVEGMTEAGTRQLMRFTFTTPNAGPGDLIIGGPAAHPEWFAWATCHQHYHFREYADYRLWTTAGYASWDALRAAHPRWTATDTLAHHPELASEFVSGLKQGFCVIDVVRYGSTAAPTYTSCGSDQGISVGWADEYHAKLDGQWVDVTSVAPGAYVLEAEVNAERLYVETDYQNNRAAVAVTV